MNQRVTKTFGLFFDAAQTLFEHKRTESGVRWKLYDDFFEISESLLARQYLGVNFKTGIITNWNEKIFQIVDENQVKKHFDTIVHANKSFNKPDKDIFLLACAHLDLSPSHCFHIGDCPYNDGEGAYLAGLTPILISRNGNQNTNFKQVNHLKDALSFACKLSEV